MIHNDICIEEEKVSVLTAAVERPKSSLIPDSAGDE